MCLHSPNINNRPYILFHRVLLFIFCTHVAASFTLPPYLSQFRGVRNRYEVGMWREGKGERAPWGRPSQFSRVSPPWPQSTGSAQAGRTSPASLPSVLINRCSLGISRRSEGSVWLKNLGPKPLDRRVRCWETRASVREGKEVLAWVWEPGMILVCLRGVGPAHRPTSSSTPSKSPPLLWKEVLPDLHPLKGSPEEPAGWGSNPPCHSGVCVCLVSDETAIREEGWGSRLASSDSDHEIELPEISWDEAHGIQCMTSSMELRIKWNI